MSQQFINIGYVVNDGTGDDLRASFDKVNTNFTELYSTTFMQATPSSSLGAAGDTAGTLRYDRNYIYVCVADYDGVSNIWKRLPLGSLTSW